MPSIAEIHLAASTTTNVKRKRESLSGGGTGVDDEIVRKIKDHQQDYFQSSPHRVFKTLPRSRPHDAKRQRIIATTSMIPVINTHLSQPIPKYTQSAPNSPLLDSDSQTTLTERPSIARATTTDLDLRACHICHRCPRKRKDLEGYISCQGCGERTCFVCVRECEGPISHRMRLESTTSHGEGFDRRELASNGWDEDLDSDPMAMSLGSLGGMDMEEDPPTPGNEIDLWDHGRTLSARGSKLASDQEETVWNVEGPLHRAIVCSRCCVERGADGEVVCLGCLRGSNTEV